MKKSEKENLVQWLQDELKETQIVVVTKQSGLTVAQVNDLRRQVAEANAGYKVMKNTLARIAVKGTRYEGLTEFFSGPTALAYSADPVAAAKAVVEFANENDKLEVIGGTMGDKVLTADEVKALAKLPSLDQLRGKLIGLLQAPAQQLASIAQAPGGKLARVFAAYGSTN